MCTDPAETAKEEGTVKLAVQTYGLGLRDLGTPYTVPTAVATAVVTTIDGSMKFGGHRSLSEFPTRKTLTGLRSEIPGVNPFRGLT